MILSYAPIYISATFRTGSSCEEDVFYQAGGVMACLAAFLRGSTLNLARPAIDWLLTLNFTARRWLPKPPRFFSANGIGLMPTKPLELFRTQEMKGQSCGQSVEPCDEVGGGWKAGMRAYAPSG